MNNSIFARISQLLRANINALIDRAEDPEVMIDQMIRDFTENIREAENSIAQTIGNVRMMEEEYWADEKSAAEWEGKALAASNKADELRPNAPWEADRFDNLAREALKRQLSFETSAKDLKPTIDAQNALVDKLKEGLNQMKTKLEELRNKRDQLAARGRMAKAQNQVQDALKNISFADPTSEINRFEEKIRREEARARGNAELEASTLEAQFNSLEDEESDSEIENRLQELKKRSL